MSGTVLSPKAWIFVVSVVSYILKIRTLKPKRVNIFAWVMRLIHFRVDIPTQEMHLFEFGEFSSAVQFPKGIIVWAWLGKGGSQKYSPGLSYGWQIT